MKAKDEERRKEREEELAFVRNQQREYEEWKAQNKQQEDMKFDSSLL